MIIYILIAVAVLFLIFGLAVASYSGVQLEETFKKYNRIPCSSKMTGGEFALKVSNNLLGGKIRVARTNGFLTDAYSSRSKVVVLSDSTCGVASVAALTVVAHEFGHAMQDLNNSKKFKINKGLAKATRVLGFFMFPLLISGIFMWLIMPDKYVIGLTLLVLSAVIFLLTVTLKLLSIPIENDASKKGIKLLQETQVLDEKEIKMAKDLLKAALYTYVGDFLRAILWWTFLTKKTKFF